MIEDADNPPGSGASEDAVTTARPGPTPAPPIVDRTQTIAPRQRPSGNVATADTEIGD